MGDKVCSLLLLHVLICLCLSVSVWFCIVFSWISEARKKALYRPHRNSVSRSVHPSQHFEDALEVGDGSVNRELVLG